MKYLIALDLDGTLLNNDSLLTEKTIETIKKLKDEHMVIIATGRPYLSSIDFYNQLELDTPFINDNGGYISNPSDDSFNEIKFPIKGSDIQTILNKGKDYIVSGLYTYKESLYAYNYNKDLARAFLAETNSVHEINDTVVDHEPGGMVFMIHAKDMSEFESIVSSKVTNITYRLWGTRGDYSFYEVYKTGVSKWTGIKEVLKLYPEINKIIAFGDDINDIEMLDNADVGVRMKNTKRLTDKVGTTITKYTNEENGVAKFLESYFQK